MKALRNHFEGEVNATRKFSKVEILLDSLHYKNEGSMELKNKCTTSSKKKASHWRRMLKSVLYLNESIT